MPEQPFGRYRLLSLLGRGGMGEVWRAVDTEKDREVALKVLGSWLNGDPQFAERFRRESALAARLHSPNIVPIHDYGEIDGRLYIDMPLIDGTDLGALLQHGPLEPARAVRIVEQVARALDVAHRAGLVHRDVKPSNILVCPDSGDHTYLIDFGIARALDGTRLSVTGAVVGTAAYMAPECFAGEGDARSDVYSLGCVLYEALTGHPPFTAPHLVAYLDAHRSAPVPRPSTLAVGVPVAMDAVVARALAKAPHARFPTTVALAAAASGALAGPPVPEPTGTRPRLAHAATVIEALRPVGGRPPSTYRPETPPPPTPAEPRAHRRRWVVAAPMAVLILVVIGVVALRPSGGAEPSPTSPSTSAPSSTPVPNLTFTGHTGSVWTAATTQLDGRPVVVTGSADDTVRIWDLTTGQQIGQPLTGHTGSVRSVAVTQLDGRPVAVTGSNDDTVRRWDLTTGQQIGQPLTGHTDNVSSVAVTQLDGRPVAVTGSNDDTVRRWGLTTGAQIGQPLTGHSDYVWSVAVTQLDGRPVAVTGSGDHTVRRWDLTTGQQIGQPLTGHTDNVQSVAVTQLDGRPVAVSGSRDDTVRVWDLTTGQQIGQPLTGHTDYVEAVATTQLDGRPVAVTGSDDHTVRIWDLTTGQQIGQPLTGYTTPIDAVAVTELDGRPVATTGSRDGTIRTWDLLAAIGK